MSLIKHLTKATNATLETVARGVDGPSRVTGAGCRALARAIKEEPVKLFFPGSLTGAIKRKCKLEPLFVGNGEKMGGIVAVYAGVGQVTGYLSLLNFL